MTRKRLCAAPPFLHYSVPSPTAYILGHQFGTFCDHLKLLGMIFLSLSIFCDVTTRRFRSKSAKCLEIRQKSSFRANNEQQTLKYGY